MFGLPVSTEIRKQVPKTVLYGKFAAELTGARKKSFENDISRILVVNEISSASVNIREGENIKSIFAVMIELRTKEYNEKNIVLITKLFGQSMFLILHHGEGYQLAIYQTKLLHSDWIHESESALKLEGLDLDTVWQNLVIQISGVVPEKEHTLDQQIEIESKKEVIRKQINKLETQKKHESQAKKKFEIHERIVSLKKELEEL